MTDQGSGAPSEGAPASARQIREDARPTTPDTRSGGGAGGGGGGRGGRSRRGGRGFRRRACYFCETREPIDFKNAQLLRRFIADSGRIETRRKTSTCARHQRELARAIKRARYLALLPYVVRRRLHA
ncbi:MAG: 30S ribosomal protein S18 [Chloroflexi bacterium]|nr:30S ribosomal protein S18 [Chloroflexota bacterium]